MERIVGNRGGEKLFIDRARGLAMLLVVMGHVLFFSIYDEKNYDGWQLFDLIAFFHMPLFFFISGMVMKYDDMDLGGLWRKFYSRSVRLMVPFFVVGLIFCFTLGSHSVNGFLSSDMKDGYWYLWVLLVFSLFNYLLIIWRKLWANKWGDLLFGMIVSIVLKLCYKYSSENVVSWLSLYQIKAYFPFFFMASWLNHYGWIEKICQSKYCQIVVLLGTPLCLVAHIHGVSHLGLISKILCVMCVIICMYMLEKCDNNCLRIIEKWGKNTMAIYIFHYFVLYMFIMPYVGFWISQHYCMGIECVIATFISVFIMEISSNIGLLLKKNSIVYKYL